MSFIKLFLKLATLVIFLSFFTLLGSKIEAAPVSCTATSDKIVVTPGQQITLTVDFADDKARSFDLTFVGSSLAPLKIFGSSDPVIKEVDAPAEAFTSVLITSPNGATDTFQCSAAVRSSLAAAPTFELPASPTGEFTSDGLIAQIITKLLPIILSVAGFISVIVIIISGIQFITSGGNPEAAGAARNRLTYAIVGFVIIVLAFALTQIVDNLFLGNTGVV